MELRYPFALVLITAIVFVEDIEIFYHPYMFAALALLFAINIMVVCENHVPQGLLVTCLFVLVFVRYYRLRTVQEKNVVI